MNNLDRYLFRGISVETGGWVHGNMIVLQGKPFIFSGKVTEAFMLNHLPGGGITICPAWDEITPCLDKVYFPNITPVIPASVGQWTGLTDKNGLQIFEGDHVVWSVNGRKEEGVVFNSGTDYDILAPGSTEWGIGWDCYRGEVEIMKAKKCEN